MGHHTHDRTCTGPFVLHCCRTIAYQRQDLRFSSSASMSSHPHYHSWVNILAHLLHSVPPRHLETAGYCVDSSKAPKSSLPPRELGRTLQSVSKCHLQEPHVLHTTVYIPPISMKPSQHTSCSPDGCHLLFSVSLFIPPHPLAYLSR